MFNKILKGSALILAVCLLFGVLSGCVSTTIGGADEKTSILVDDKPHEKETDDPVTVIDPESARNELELCALVKANSPESYGFNESGKWMDIRKEYPVDDAFLEAMRDFSKKTSAAIENNGENIIYSPMSLYFALAMVTSGTSGEAEDELTALLGVEKDDLAAQCEALYRIIYDDNEIGKTKIANSVWLDRNKGVKIKDEWLKTVSEGFFAPVYNVDLADKATGDLIGAWIHDNTGGMLSYDFEPDPMQVMALINNVYLTDEWTDLFNEEQTQPDLFTNRDGSTFECDFMNKDDLGSFYKTENYSMCSLGLKNGGSVTFILPAEGIDPQTMLYDESVYDRIFGWDKNDTARGYGRITWKVPKFSCQSKFNFTDTLRSLGVNAIFDRTDAMTDITDDELFVSKVIQKAKVSVNEKGIEAAAYTEISYCGSAVPTDTCEMILDRPFAYVVTTDYNVPIFVGVVNEIE